MITITDKFTKLLIIAIFGLLIYLALFKPTENAAILDQLEKDNERIVKQLELLKVSIEIKLDSLELIERKEIQVRNFYNEIIQELDTVNTFGSANIRIRKQLDSLGTARFD